jgi:filamentous hemagglutinin family protein
MGRSQSAATSRQCGARRRRALLAGASSAAVAALLAFPQPAAAAPPTAVNAPPTFASGSGSYNATPTKDTVTVFSPETLINWAPTDTATGGGPISFLPAGNTLEYNYDGTNFTVVNRIVPNDPSRAIRFDGAVNSFGNGGGTVGGNIFFYSPGGIILGGTARFDVGSLVLTTTDLDLTGGAFGAGGNTLSFTGPVGGGGITLEPVQPVAGDRINHMIEANDFVVMFAPRVDQGGTVYAGGSVAYVGAEQGTLTLNGSLFDFAVGVGTDDPNGVIHGGTTGGPNFFDTRQIAMVAVPKNDFVTMLVGGTIGYDAASSAGLVDGNIVLKAGDASKGLAGSVDVGPTVFQNDTQIDANGTIDFHADGVGNQIIVGQSGNPDSIDLSAAATGDITLKVTNGAGYVQSGNLVLNSGTQGQGGDITLLADATGVSAPTATNGIKVGGGLTANSRALGANDSSSSGIGGDAVAGNITFDVNNGAQLAVGGNLVLNASARAGFGSAKAGDATAGNVAMTVDGANSAATVTGNLSLVGNALAATNPDSSGPSIALVGGDARGGNITLTANDANLSAGTVLLNSSAVASSGNDATIAQSNDANAGDISLSFTGGTQDVANFLVGGLSVAGQSFDGAGSYVGGVAGRGTAKLAFDASDTTVSGTTLVSVNTTGDLSAAAPGTAISLTADNGASFVSGATILSADHNNGESANASVAGSIDVTAQNNSSMNLGPTQISARDEGNSSFANYATDKQGGDVTLNAFSSAIQVGGLQVDTGVENLVTADGAAQHVGGAISITAAGSGVSSFSSEGDVQLSSAVVLPRGGDMTALASTAGEVTVRQAGAAASINLGSLAIDASARDNGDTAFIGDGATAHGGQVNLNVDGGAFFAGNITVDNSAHGGAGGTAIETFGTGAGRGGEAVDGSFIVDLDNNASFQTNGLVVDTSAVGGAGGDASIAVGSVTGGRGGDAFGNGAEFRLVSGTFLVGDSFSIDASAQGGKGGDGFGASGGEGGDAFAGGAGIIRGATDVTFGSTSVVLSANAQGGAGGAAFAYTTPPVLTDIAFIPGTTYPAGTPGSGGDGTGGYATYSATGGSDNFLSVDLEANGTGGVGGSLTGLPADNATVAGTGGVGAGGTATFDLAVDDDAGKSFTAIAHGTGGAGGEGPLGGAGGAARGGIASIGVRSAAIFADSGNLQANAYGGAGGTSDAVGSAGATGGLARGGVAVLGIGGKTGSLDLGSTISIYATAEGGAGSAGGAGDATTSGGLGGTGGAAIGGDVRMVADLGAVAPFDTSYYLLNADAFGGDAGAGGDNTAGGQAGYGGTGGAGTGGALTLAATNGGAIQVMAFSDGTSTLASFGTGGAGGAGGSIDMIAGGNTGNGGDGGAGTGGTVNMLGNGGSITGPDFNLISTGYGGNGGTGGGDGASTLGGPGSGGAGYGGTVNLAVAGPGAGSITLGNVNLTANGIGGDPANFGSSFAGNVEVSDTSTDPTGLISVISLNASSLGDVAPAGDGVHFTGDSGPIALSGDLSVNSVGDATFDFDGDGQLTVAGVGNVFARDAITVTHTANAAGTISIDVGASANFITQAGFLSDTGSVVSSGNYLYISTGLAASAADLRGYRDISIGAQQDVNLGNATITGPVAIADSSIPSAANGIYIDAGLLTDTALYSAGYDATITGAVSSSGNVVINAGGSAIFAAGSSVAADNAIAVRTGDDIVVGTGASLESAISPVATPTFGAPFSDTANLSLYAGGIREDGNLSGDPASPIASILLDGSLRANDFAVTLLGDAIDASGGTIDASSFSADIISAPDDGVPLSDDAGLLSAGCEEGNICVGSLTAGNRVEVGQASGNGEISFTLGTPSLSSTDVLITTRHDLLLGTTGTPNAITAANLVSLTSTAGDVGLFDLAISAPQILIDAAGSLVGNGSLTTSGASDIGVTVGDSFSAGIVAPGGQLTTVAGVGGAPEGTYSVAGNFRVDQYLQNELANFAINAGGDISIGTAQLPGTDIALTAGGDVFLGTMVTAGNIALDGENITFNDLDADNDLAITSSGSLVQGGNATAHSGALSVAAAGAIAVGALSAPRIDLSAPLGINTGAIAGSDHVGIVGGGRIQTGAIETTALGSDVMLTGGAGIQYTTIGSAGSVALDAVGAVLGSGITAGTDATVSAAVINLSDVSAGGDLAIASDVGNLKTGALSAGQTIAVDSAGTATIAGADAGTGLTVTAAGALSGGSFTAGGAASLTAGTIAIGNLLSSGGSVDAHATAGDASLALAQAATDATVTATGVADVGSAISGGATTITGSSVLLDGGTVGGLLRLDATAGDLTIASGVITGGGIDLDAAGSVMFDTLDAAGLFTVDAGGPIGFTVASNTGGAIAMTAGGAIAGGGVDTAANGGIDDSISIAAGDGLTLGTVSSGDGLTLSGAGVSTLDLAANGALQVTSGGVAGLGGLSAGGSIDVSATNLTLASASAGGALSLTATSGPIASPGALESLGGSANFTAGGAISYGTSSAASDLTMTAGGNIAGGQLDAGGLLKLDGARILIGVANAGSIDLRAGAILDFNSLVAANDASLIAGTALTGGTIATGSGAIDVNAGSVSLTGASSGGDLSLVARTGDIAVTSAMDSGGALSLRANNGGIAYGQASATTDLTMTAGNAVSGGALTVGSALDIGADGIAIGDATAGSIDLTSASTLGFGALVSTLDSNLTAVGAVTGDTIDAGGGLELDAGSVHLASASTGGAMAITASVGDIYLGSADAGGALSLTASAGSIALPGLLRSSGGSLDASASGDIDYLSGSAAADLILGAGGSLSGGDLDAGGDLILVGDSLAIGGGSAASITMSSGTTLGFASLSSIGDTNLSATGALAGGTIEAGGAVGVDAGSVNLTRVSSGGDLTIGSASGDLTLDSADAGGALSLNAAAGSIASTGLLRSSGGSVSATASGAIGYGSASAASDLTMTAGGAIGGGDLQAGDALTLDGGALALGDATAGSIDLTSTSILNFGALTSTGDTGLSASGALAGGTIHAGGAVDATAGSVDLTGATSGGNLTIATNAGDLAIGAADSGGALALTASSGSVTSSGLLASSGASVSVSASGDIDYGSTSAASDLVMAAGGAISGGALDAGGALTLDGGSLAIGDANAASIDLTSGATLGFGALVSTGDSKLAATGALTGNSVDAGGALDVRAASTSLADAASGGDLSITADSGDLALGSAHAGRALALHAGAGSIASTGLLASAGSSVSLDAAGSIAYGSARAATDLGMTAGGTITGGRLDAGGLLTLSGDGIAIGDATAGSMALTSGSDLGFSSLAATGSITLDASSGAIGVNGGPGDIDAGTDVTLKARSIDLGAVHAGGSIDARATAGGASFLSLDAGEAISLVASGMPVAGSVTSGGDTVISGSQVTLSNANIGGAMSLTATAGDIAISGTNTVGGAIDLDASGAASFTDLSATGDFRVNAGTDITAELASATGVIDFSAGGAIALGTGANAGTSLSLAAAGNLAAGDLDAGGAIALTSGGNLGFGDATLSGGSFDANATGSIAGGDVTGAGPLAMTAGTTLGFGELDAASDVTLRAGGAATGGAINAGGAIDVSAAALSVTDLTSGGNLVLVARTGDLALGSADAGARLFLNAGRGDIAASGVLEAGTNAALNAAGTIDYGSISSANALAITAGGAVTGGSLAAGRALSLNAGALAIGDATAGSIALTSASDLAFGSLSSSGDTVLRATGALDGGAIAAGGVADVRAGAVTLTDVASGNALTILADNGDVSLTSADGGGAVDIEASGAIGVGGLVRSRTDGATLVSGGALAFGSAGAAGDLRMTAAGSISGGGLDAGGVLALTGDGIAIGDATAGSIALTSDGALDFGALDSTADASLQPRVALTGDAIDGGGAALVRGGSVGLGSATSGAGLTIAAVSGDLALGSGTAVDALSLTAVAGSVDVTGSLDAGGAFSVQAANIAIGDANAGSIALASDGALAFGALASSGDATIGAAGALSGGSVGAGGALDIEGGTVSIAGATSGNDLSVVANAGDLRLAGADAGGSLSLSATNGAIAVAGLAQASGGDALHDAAGAVTDGSVAAADNLSITAGGAVRGGALDAGGALTIKGSAIAITDASAASISLTSGADLDFASLAADGAVSATAAGAIGGPGGMASIDAGGDVRLAASTIDLGAVRSGGSIDASASAGGANFASLTAANSVTLTAAGVPVAGAVTSGGDTSITGAQVDLDNATVGGALTLKATDGGITVGDSASVGGAISLTATGGVGFADLAAGGGFTIRSGGAISGGGATAAGALDFGSDGAIALSDGATAGGSLKLASGGDIDAASLVAGGPINLDAGGDLTFSSAMLSGGAFGARAAGALSTGEVSGASDIAMTSGTSLGFDSLGATGDITLQAGGALAGGSIDAGGAIAAEAASADLDAATSGGDLAIAANAGGVSLATGKAGANISLTAAGAIATTTLTAGDAIDLSAGTNLAASSLTAGTQIAADAGGTIAAATVTAGTTANLGAGSTLTVGTISGRTIGLRSVNGAVVVTHDFAATGSGAPTSTIAGAAVQIDDVNGVSAASVEATNGDIDVTATGDIAITSARSVGDINLTSSEGAVDVGLAEAGVAGATPKAVPHSLRPLGLEVGSPGPGNIAVSAATDASGAFIASGSVAIDAAGAIDLHGADAAGALELTAGGPIAVDGRASAGTSVAAISSGDFLVSEEGQLEAGGDLQAAAGGLFSAQGLVSGQTIDLTAHDLDIGVAGQLGDATATRDITLTNNGAPVVLGGTDATDGAYSLTNDEFSRIHSGGSVAVIAHASEETGADLTVRDLSISAAPGGNIGTDGALSLTSDRGLAIVGDVALHDAGDSSQLRLESGAITLDSTTGNLRVEDGNGAASGLIHVTADSFVAATPEAQADVAGASPADIDTRLAQTDGVVRDEGVIQAGAVEFTVADALLIQNTGQSPDLNDRRGLTADTLRIDVPEEGQGLAVVNAVVGGKTGADALAASELSAALDPGSTINGCPVSNPASCIAVEPPVTGDIFHEPIRDLIEGEIDVNADLESTLDSQLIQLAPPGEMSHDPLIDDPVTGAGNDDLWVAEPDCDPAAKDKSTCPASATDKKPEPAPAG